MTNKKGIFRRAEWWYITANVWLIAFAFGLPDQTCQGDIACAVWSMLIMLGPYFLMFNRGGHYEN